MRRRAGVLLGAVVGLVLLSGAAAESFRFSADRVESSLAAGRERTVLTGRAFVVSGSLEIRADRIEISGKDYDLLECRGGVRTVDGERGIEIRTPNLRYERKAKRALMTGPSVLIDRGNRVVLKALRIEDDGLTEVTVAEASVRILKEELSCRAEYAVYRRADAILELTGAPRVYKKGDEFRASRITVDTDTEEVRLEGAVAGSVRSSGQEAPAPPVPPAPPAEAVPPPAADPGPPPGPGSP